MLTFSILEPFSSKLWHGVSTRANEHEQVVDVDLFQPHGGDVIWTEQPIRYNDSEAQVDGVFTKKPQLRIRAGGRDCAPIILYDAKHNTVGTVHAGLKGTTQNILQNALQEVSVSDVYIGIGPAIGPCCYFGIDVQQENMQQALALGVPVERIEVMSYCTRCNNDIWFSHRAGDNINCAVYAELHP